MENPYFEAFFQTQIQFITKAQYSYMKNYKKKNQLYSSCLIIINLPLSLIKPIEKGIGISSNIWQTFATIIFPLSFPIINILLFFLWISSSPIIVYEFSNAFLQF